MYEYFDDIVATYQNTCCTDYYTVLNSVFKDTLALCHF